VKSGQKVTVVLGDGRFQLRRNGSGKPPSLLSFLGGGNGALELGYVQLIFCRRVESDGVPVSQQVEVQLLAQRGEDDAEVGQGARLVVFGPQKRGKCFARMGAWLAGKVDEEGVRFAGRKSGNDRSLVNNLQPPPAMKSSNRADSWRS